jgi:hypothetical protein
MVKTMAKMKTQETTASVKGFIDNVSNARRKSDAKVILKIMKSITKKQSKMWGPSIVGFGIHHYKYANGSEGKICKVGFSPRAQSLAFYLGKFKERTTLLKKLGKHKLGGGGCLYINKLDDIDLDVLTSMIDKAYLH